MGSAHSGLQVQAKCWNSTRDMLQDLTCLESLQLQCRQ